jgi:ferritin-like metal-binding protein YciE
MSMEEASALLRETLDEDKTTDAKLTELAKSEINLEAEATEDESEEKPEKPKRRALGARHK